MKKILQGGALLVFAGLITACGSASYTDSVGDSGTSGSNDYAANEQYESSDQSPSSPSFETGDFETDRQIIITGNLYATATDPFKAADDVLNLVTKAGGFAENRNQSGKVADGTASASLTVRIPADSASKTIADLEEEIEVYELNTNKEDVTAHVADVEARIAALETSVERLGDLMAEATSSEALFEAEEALTRRQGELDSLRAVQRSLADRVSLATLNINIDSEEVYTSPPDGFMGGLTAGWKGLVATFLTVLTAVGALIPWLIVLVPAGLLIVWLIRRARSRRDGVAGGVEVVSGTEVVSGAEVGAAETGDGADVGKVDQEATE